MSSRFFERSVSEVSAVSTPQDRPTPPYGFSTLVESNAVQPPVDEDLEDLEDLTAFPYECQYRLEPLPNFKYLPTLLREYTVVSVPISDSATNTLLCAVTPDLLWRLVASPTHRLTVVPHGWVVDFGPETPAVLAELYPRALELVQRSPDLVRDVVEAYSSYLDRRLTRHVEEQSLEQPERDREQRLSKAKFRLRQEAVRCAVARGDIGDLAALLAGTQGNAEQRAKLFKVAADAIRVDALSNENLNLLLDTTKTSAGNNPLTDAAAVEWARRVVLDVPSSSPHNHQEENEADVLLRGLDLLRESSASTTSPRRARPEPSPSGQEEEEPLFLPFPAEQTSTPREHKRKASPAGPKKKECTPAGVFHHGGVTWEVTRCVPMRRGARVSKRTRRQQP